MPLLKNGCFCYPLIFHHSWYYCDLFLTTIVFGTPLNSAKSLAIPPTPTLQFNFSNYLDSISNVISSLFHPTSITYRINNAGTLSPDRDLFPYLLESYTHTLMIMICAFLIAVLLSTFTILTFYFPRRIQSLILKTLHVLESLPDLFLLSAYSYCHFDL